MTRKEAIDLLDNLKGMIEDSKGNDYDEAFRVAIEALEQEPKTGHWIEENINGYGRKVFCSECGCPPPFEHISSGDIYSANGYGVINKTKFCPNCGFRMIEQQESEVSK